MQLMCWSSRRMAPDEDGCAEIDRIAVLIGARIDDQTAKYGHYTASRFSARWNTGPCSSRPAPAPTHDARGSYSGNIIPGPDQEG